MFREEDNRLRVMEDISAEFERFSTPAVHAAVAALADVDSITIDPHKLGYFDFLDCLLTGFLGEPAQ